MTELKVVAAVAAVGVAALAYKLMFGSPSGASDRKQEEVGGPYNIRHTGHVREYEAGHVVKALQGDSGIDRKFTLYYLPIRGRAEAPRVILHDCKIQFDDIRFTSDEWKAFKEKESKSGKLPFGQVPLLEHGSFHLVQSNAILRYLGRKLDRYGSTDEERSLADQLMDGAEDSRLAYGRLIYTDKVAEDKKAAYLTKWRGEMANFQNLLGDRKYFVNAEFTVADASMYELLDIHNRLFPGLMEEFPQLKAFHQRVEQRPNVRRYLESNMRPERINGNGLGQ